MKLKGRPSDVHLARSRIHLDSRKHTDNSKKTFEPSWLLCHSLSPFDQTFSVFCQWNMICACFFPFDFAEVTISKSESVFVNCLCNSSTPSRSKPRRSHNHIKSWVRAFTANALGWVNDIAHTNYTYQADSMYANCFKPIVNTFRYELRCSNCYFIYLFAFLVVCSFFINDVLNLHEYGNKEKNRLQQNGIGHAQKSTNT